MSMDNMTPDDVKITVFRWLMTVCLDGTLSLSHSGISGLLLVSHTFGKLICQLVEYPQVTNPIRVNAICSPNIVIVIFSRTPPEE